MADPECRKITHWPPVLNPPPKCHLGLNFLNVTMFGIKWATSLENLFMPYVNDKDSDQPVHPHSLISKVVVRCFDSIIPIVTCTHKVRLPVLLYAVKTVEGDFRFCWMISPNIGQTRKENPNSVRLFIWHLHWMIYTNSTINYTNIDTQKSVHFAVPRTETCLKMHQPCIWNTGHVQSIAGPVHALTVWTDEKKNNTELFL